MSAHQDQKSFFAAHWDWLVAAGGLLVLGVSVFFLMAAYTDDPDQAALDAVASLGHGKARTAIEPVDMTAYDAAMKILAIPTTLVEPAETQSSYLSSGPRVFCEQGEAGAPKSCGQPIPFGAKVCPFCQAKQPVEVKVALDSDGDGLSDDEEVKLGLNPNDATDIDADMDNDGFSNREEIAAKTDLKDPQSHPNYLDYVSIKLPLKETLLPLIFERAMQIPGGIRFYFKNLDKKNEYGKKGVSYAVLEGEAIGDTGFIAKSYEKKIERRIIDGTGTKSADGKLVNALSRDADVSTATIERVSDKKKIALRVGDKKRAPVDTQVTLVFSRGGGKEFVVVLDDTIELYGVPYKVASISREDKKVRVLLANEKFGKKVIEALEQ